MTSTVTRLSNVSPNPSTVGTIVSINAMVSPSPFLGETRTVTGVVTFKDGTTILGTAVLAGFELSGLGSISLSTLAAGSHVITAEYGGDVNFDPSVSAPVTLVVNAVVTPPPHDHGHHYGRP